MSDEIDSYRGEPCARTPSWGRFGEDMASSIQGSRNAVNNALSSVRTFQRWLFKDNPRLFRDSTCKIQDMTPNELDTHLAKFFANVKPRRGGDYRPGSLKHLRDNIQYYLRSVHFPYSLLSPVFAKSQLALKERIWSLKHPGNSAAEG